jgi:hypothetical protein
MTIACAVTGTTTASCKQTVIRPADDMEPNGGYYGSGDDEIFSTVSGTDSGLVTQALETTMAGTDMEYYPVTITAGSLKSAGESGGGSGSATSGTGAAASASESASASADAGSGASGAAQLMIEVVGVAAAGSIALLMVVL